MSQSLQNKKRSDVPNYLTTDSARVFVFDYRAGMEMAVRALGGSYSTVRAGRPTGLNPLQTEIDVRGQAWLADWLASLLERRDRPLTPVQTNRLQEVVRQNASAGHAGLRNWSDFASLLVSTDDEGDLFERMQEWTAEGRYGWIFGANAEDSFSIDGDVAGFDLTGILDSESERERMAVLSYLFRRVERVSELKDPDSYAHARRQRCQDWAAIPDYEEGDKIKLAAPVTLTDGSTCQIVTATHYKRGRQKRRCYRIEETGGLVRLSKASLAGSELLSSAKGAASPVLAEYLAGRL